MFEVRKESRVWGLSAEVLTAGVGSFQSLVCLPATKQLHQFKLRQPSMQGAEGLAHGYVQQLQWGMKHSLLS